MLLRQVKRSRYGKVSGVCAGLADAYECDTIMMRIFFIALTLATVGLGGIAYAVLWRKLPQASKLGGVVDVSPKEVHSSTYGRVRYVSRLTPGLMRDKRSRYVVAASSKAEQYASVAHMPPPEPPCIRGKENFEKHNSLF